MRKLSSDFTNEYAREHGRKIKEVWKNKAKVGLDFNVSDAINVKSVNVITVNDVKFKRVE